jgi:hypothetical protein
VAAIFQYDQLEGNFVEVTVTVYTYALHYIKIFTLQASLAMAFAHASL